MRTLLTAVLLALCVVAYVISVIGRRRALSAHGHGVLKCAYLSALLLRMVIILGVSVVEFGVAKSLAGKAADVAALYGFGLLFLLSNSAIFIIGLNLRRFRYTYLPPSEEEARRVLGVQ